METAKSSMRGCSIGSASESPLPGVSGQTTFSVSASAPPSVRMLHDDVGEACSMSSVPFADPGK